jgi:hypothetical protein
MPDTPPENAARSACGHGSMDDDDHALSCVACNIARHNDWRRDQRLRRQPKAPLRRALNRAMRLLVLGDPLFLPDKTDIGHVR